MKKIALAILLFLFESAAVLAGEIQFVDTYENALKIAAEKNRNILITFYADW
jgi:hypothetical protein